MLQVGTAVRSLTVAMDGSLMVAANNNGTCYVWRAMRGSFMTTHFEPLHKLKAHQGERFRAREFVLTSRHSFYLDASEASK